MNLLRRQIKSFVRRESRMTDGQKKSYDAFWLTYGLSPEEKINIKFLFPDAKKIALDIGFGNGETLLSMARSNPDIGYLGAEVYRTGVGKVLRCLHDESLNNVRVFCADVIEVLDHALPDACLDEIYIFFPDPWHKKRHHKRRLIQASFLDRLFSKLVSGGVIYLATDWENYAEHILECFSKDERWKNLAGEKLFLPRFEQRPLTRFEERGERLGHQVWDFGFRKNI